MLTQYLIKPREFLIIKALNFVVPHKGGKGNNVEFCYLFVAEQMVKLSMISDAMMLWGLFQYKGTILSV